MGIVISCPTVLSEEHESEKNSEREPEKRESLLCQGGRAPGGVTMIVGVMGVDLCTLPD